MFIQTEQTPNPETLKFLPGRVVMEDGTAFYQSVNDTSDSPLAKKLFDVDGVIGVFLGSDFITITKKENLEWQVLKPSILGSIMDHFNSGEETYLSKKTEDTKKSLKENSNDSEIVKQMIETEVNKSNAAAIVEEISQKNAGKYL